MKLTEVTGSVADEADKRFRKFMMELSKVAPSKFHKDSNDALIAQDDDRTLYVSKMFHYGDPNAIRPGSYLMVKVRTSTKTVDNEGRAKWFGEIIPIIKDFATGNPNVSSTTSLGKNHYSWDFII